MSEIRHEVYEVFGQPGSGEPHVHAGSLLAPSAQLALLFARENFTRRGEYVSLWVVPRADITRGPEDPAWLSPSTDKSYRLGVGYRDTVQKWRRFGAVREGASGGGH